MGPGPLHRRRASAWRRGQSRLRRQRRREPCGTCGRLAQGVIDPLIAFIECRGRAPEPEELPETVAVTQRFGSIKPALAVVRRVTGDEAWQAARAAATDDLIVYLALAAFGGLPKFTGLPLDVQHDVQAFFGSYKGGVCGGRCLTLPRRRPSGRHAVC